MASSITEIAMKTDKKVPLGRKSNPYGKRAILKMLIKSVAEKQRSKAGVTSEEMTKSQIKKRDEIADAMKEAAIKVDVAVRWGAAWTVTDIREWKGTMEEAMNSYIDTRRGQGRRPFIDAPHFELM